MYTKVTNRCVCMCVYYGVQNNAQTQKRTLMYYIIRTNGCIGKRIAICEYMILFV